MWGTGDFTHPAWREELKEKLEPAEDGLYTLKDEYRIHDAAAPDDRRPRFVVTGEISSIYKQGERVRKVHSLLLLPGLEAADMLSARLELIGNIHSDGRPILGLDSRDLLELTLDTCPDAESSRSTSGRPLRSVWRLLRLRYHGGVLRGSDRPHPRGGDGPLL